MGYIDRIGCVTCSSLSLRLTNRVNPEEAKVEVMMMMSVLLLATTKPRLLWRRDSRGPISHCGLSGESGLTMAWQIMHWTWQTILFFVSIESMSRAQLQENHHASGFLNRWRHLSRNLLDCDHQVQRSQTVVVVVVVYKNHRLPANPVTSICYLGNMQRTGAIIEDIDWTTAISSQRSQFCDTRRIDWIANRRLPHRSRR